MTRWTYSPQKGKLGHCFQAQVWNEKGQSIAVIESTKNTKDATATAKLMSEAPKLKEQNQKMHEALKTCKSFIDYHSVCLLDFELEFKKNIDSLLKEIKS